MKRMLLLLLAAFLFASCNKDYEEKKWVVFNEYSKDVSISINNINYTAKANSTTLANAIMGDFSITPLFKINTEAHLKCVQSWYYSGGNTWQLCTIKEQDVIGYYIIYDGKPEDVIVVSGLFKNEEGKYKRLTYTLDESKKPQGAKASISDTYVFSYQTVYEEELPAYLFYKFNTKATEEDRTRLFAMDYINPSEYECLSMMYSPIRKKDSLNVYYEFLKEL
ncbi:MAG: hypothetical protein II098_10845 [Treponema sp.]|nr:hypothetical protein [Treponema sp.]